MNRYFKTQCDTKKIENCLVLVGLIHWGKNVFCEKDVKKTKSTCRVLGNGVGETVTIRATHVLDAFEFM